MRLAVLVLAAAAAWSQSFTEVRGVVIDRSTNRPISGAVVKVEGTPQATTDANGRFSALARTPSIVTFTVVKEGYTSPFGALPTQVTIAEGERVDDLILRLEPEAVIKGTIRSERGEPLSGFVQVIDAKTPAHVGSGTARNGELLIRQLPPGEFRISVQPTAGAPVTYYPSELDPARAMPIRVSAGETRTGIDIVVRDVAMRTLKGRFVGQVPAGHRCTIGWERPDRTATGTTATGYLEKDGRFRVQIPPGDYLVKLRCLPPDGRYSVTAGYRRLSAADTALDDFDIPASPIRTVRARIRWADARRDPVPSTVTVGLNPTTGLGTLRAGNRQPDDSILMPEVSPDRYVFLIHTLGSVYVKSILAAVADDITARGLDLIDGSQTDVEVLLADDGAAVSGTVTLADGRPAPGASVNFSWAPDHENERYLWSTSATADARGTFRVESLHPGKYNVSVRFENRKGTPVTVEVSPRQTPQPPLTLIVP